ncbi:UDP-glucose dehydrogenase family protein [Dermatobacter hominis]|uniref:UDP-glucose dehydrogenase family protein n=1 Tax=Dermatobacter hominis TaxID=2884263 RepID=UPI001D10520F|nr:UDP-glucose/GDP-mannose dehydrogenase family protein [Dermatobacter hominis]UDY37503.1 UDP-glucose/GDP-mannose dehydrogenase family protein [Dermatobacter hominis]
MGSRIAVVGTGYVGLTTGACLAHLGHEVVCLDTDRDKLRLLARGTVPFREPGLEGLVAAGVASGRLSWTDDVERTWDREFTFLCVPTPAAPDGSAEMGAVREASRSIGPHLAPGSVLIAKSTLPVGALDLVSGWLGRCDVGLAVNPEFLREGSAVTDWLSPDRIVVGADDPEVASRVAGIFDGIERPLVLTDPRSAQLAKYACNAFLALKVSFVNAVATLCGTVAADPRAVLRAMALDPRIGPQHLQPGPGWGGSCFPKDLAALGVLAREQGCDLGLVDEAVRSNERHLTAVADRVVRLAGSEQPTVGVWGLTFKAGTDDLRDSPALAVIERLIDRGAQVRAHDPTVPAGADLVDGLDVVGCPYEACTGADALVVLTGWDEYRRAAPLLLAATMAGRSVLDTRDVLDVQAYRDAGLAVQGIGR